MKALLVLLALSCVRIAQAQPPVGRDVTSGNQGTVSESDAADIRSKILGATGDRPVIATDAGFKSVKPLLPDIGVKFDHGDDPRTRRPDWKRQLDITAIDGGDRNETSITGPRLEAIVRLMRAGETTATALICTGAAVNWDGERGILTAAHCLYEVGPDETISPAMRSSVRVQSLGIDIPTSMARIHPSFARCLGLHYEECDNIGGVDVAFIPFATTPEPWSVCTLPPATTEFVGYGFGLNVSFLPDVVLSGDLHLTGDMIGGLYKANSARRQQVNKGDSGGPVIAQSDAGLFGVPSPNVCFVAAARKETFSLLQPLWKVMATMADRP